MIEAIGLTKRYGATVAVDELSFTVPPGQVTGFLGPNGAGKSTTMRLILGLDAPTAGRVTVSGRSYTAYPRPLFEVGALLEAKAAHGARSAYHHLLCLALSNGIAKARVEQVLEQVGLVGVAGKRVGGFSLGMGQRLGIAAALLGDPPVLMLDEPVNGLDPEGVRWIRELLKSLAAEGRTVFLSSHLMSEMALTADRLIIVGRGRLIAQTTVEDLLRGGSGNHIRVRSPQSDTLASLLQARGVTVACQPDGALQLTDADPQVVGELARANGVTLLELSTQQASLEDRYMELTSDAVDYRTTDDPRGQSRPVMTAAVIPQFPYRPLSSLRDVLRSELCKLRTVRSTRWTLAAAVVSNVLLAALAAIFIPSHLSAQDKATTDPVRLSLAGLHLSQIAIGVLGALVITSEYGTGMIRATFTAVPRRRLVLTSKVIVFAAAALAVGIASSFAAYFTFQAFLSGNDLTLSMSDPGVLRAVTGGGLYLAVLGLLGLGLGLIIRSSAGAIASLFGILFVPSILISILPHSWQTTIGPYLPMNAGEQIFIAVHHDANSLGAWTGFGVFSLYAAAALTTGFLLINRRDA